MTEFTEAQKEAMRQYKQPFIEKINELDIVDTLGLKKARNGGFICPCCKSGSGSNATGAQVTKDHKRITCFANTDCPMNGNGHGQDVYGALQAVTGKTGDAILKYTARLFHNRGTASYRLFYLRMPSLAMQAL